MNLKSFLSLQVLVHLPTILPALLDALLAHVSVGLHRGCVYIHIHALLAHVIGFTHGVMCTCTCTCACTREWIYTGVLWHTMIEALFMEVFKFRGKGFEVPRAQVV